MNLRHTVFPLLVLSLAACFSRPRSRGDVGVTTNTSPPAPSCNAAGGSAMVAVPTLKTRLADAGQESWLGSPAVVDLDASGSREVVVVRGSRLFVWNADGTLRFSFDTMKDRIWASPVVANFVGDAKLELAVAAHDSLHLIDASGQELPGFPQSWGSEIRALAAGDVDGDGRLDIVVAVKTGDSPGDVVRAYHGNGDTVAGFPPVATGTSGCSDTRPCYFAGLYDQNLAIGDLNGDGKQDLVAPHDNSYASFFEGTGVAFDSAPEFIGRSKTPGVRYLLALPEAEQALAANEDTSLQAHFTNTAPAIADLDLDGVPDIVMLGSVQNVAQTNRELGVGLWALHSNAARLSAWQTPLQIRAYVAGLWDGFAPDATTQAVANADNLVGATNQVAIADIDPTHPGPEILFAGFDGRIHAVAADSTELWSTAYAEDGRALTGGVVVGDLSGDGSPEIVFASYSPDVGKSALYVLSARGAMLHSIPLPQRGAMAVPTLADVDGDGVVDIVVSLKDSAPNNESVLVYSVASASENCLLWPTGRGNYLRNGWVR